MNHSPPPLVEVLGSAGTSARMSPANQSEMPSDAAPFKSKRELLFAVFQAVNSNPNLTLMSKLDLVKRIGSTNTAILPDPNHRIRP